MEEHEQTGVLDIIVSKISHIAMWMSAMIVVIILYEVILRYVFSRPTLWAYELSWWLAGALYLLSGLYVMQQRAHIRLTLLYDILPRPLRRVCDLAGMVVLICFCFAVVWGGLDAAWAKLMRWEGLGSAWNPPIPATLKPLILVVVFLLALQALSNQYYDWNKKEKPDEALRDTSPRSQ